MGSNVDTLIIKDASKKDLKRLFERQQDFNKIFYESDISIEEKEEITKSLSLALHSEISSLISAINFKDHKHNRREIDKCKILFEYDLIQ